MDPLQAGVTAARHGQRAKARTLLEQALRSDLNNERAWLWISTVVKTDAERQTCLERALALQHRNPSYQKADIPFDNVIFKGAPVVHDEYIVDVDNGSTTITDGTWYMLNTKWMGFSYDKKKSFKLGPNVRPNNQLVTTALMPVRGAHWTNNRRKLGVLGDVAIGTLETATS